MAELRDDAISFCCSLDGAAINYGGSADELVGRFVKSLGKVLGKKGIALLHEPTMSEAAVQIRFVQIEQGNRALRYFLPFLAPAFVEVETDLNLQHAPESLNYRQSAQFGLFGGSPSGMLGVCVDRIGGKLAKDLLRRIA